VFMNFCQVYWNTCFSKQTDCWLVELDTGTTSCNDNRFFDYAEKRLISAIILWLYNEYCLYRIILLNLQGLI